MDLWVDASSLSTRVLLGNYGIFIEDAYWLHPDNDSEHINLEELDAVMKGVNLALQGQSKMLHLKTD